MARTNITLSKVLELIKQPNTRTGTSWFTREDAQELTGATQTAIARAFRTIEADPRQYLVELGSVENRNGTLVAAISYKYTDVSEAAMARTEALEAIDALTLILKRLDSPESIQGVTCKINLLTNDVLGFKEMNQ